MTCFQVLQRALQPSRLFPSYRKQLLKMQRFGACVFQVRGRVLFEHVPQLGQLHSPFFTDTQSIFEGTNLVRDEIKTLLQRRISTLQCLLLLLQHRYLLRRNARRHDLF